MLTQTSKLTGLGLFVLACGALVVPACGNGSDGPRDDSTGAKSGSGNDSGASNGGKSGGNNGGNTNGGTSGGGTGGGSGQVVTECPGVVPMGPTIADFEMTPADGALYEWGSAEQGTMDFWGGTFNYPTAFEVTVADGELTAAGMVTEYAGFGLYVQNCADASAFEGVRFTISGTPPAGEKVHFAVQTNQNEWASGVKGSCMAPDAQKFTACVHPSVAIDVTGEPQTIEVKWADLGMGKPAASATTDGSDVIGLQWIVPWAEKHAAYEASFTLDNVELIGEGEGMAGSGSGGAGNEPAGGGAGGQGGAG